MNFGKQPHGRGCYTFEGLGMLHGHYIHLKDPNFDGDVTEVMPPLSADEQGDEEILPPLPKGPAILAFFDIMPLYVLLPIILIAKINLQA